MIKSQSCQRVAERKADVSIVRISSLRMPQAGSLWSVFAPLSLAFLCSRACVDYACTQRGLVLCSRMRWFSRVSDLAVRLGFCFSIRLTRASNSFGGM